MAHNPRRRVDVTDAALRILGRDGSRALTHRAVDALAALPQGTTANYFPTRASLLLAMAQRIFVRLTPDASRLATQELLPAAEALPEYVGAVVERLIQSPDLARALIELRLEGSRSPEIADALAPFLRRGLHDDVAFHEARGLPGGADMVVRLHHLVNGIVLDHLTIPLEPGRDPVLTAKETVAALALSRRAP